MDLDAKYINDVRAGKRCCYNAKMVEFVSGHLCMRDAPQELKDVVNERGMFAAIDELKILIPDWKKIKWQRPRSRSGDNL